MIRESQSLAIFRTLPVMDEKALVGHMAYRVKTKLFATVWMTCGWANFRVGADEQRMLLTDRKFFIPRNGIKNGWVGVELAKIKENEYRELAWKAWRLAAPKRLSIKY
jgi:hypothetical protein